MPTVWISRPPHRAAELALALRENKITPLLHPAMHIDAPPDDAPLNTYLAAVAGFALHIFVSREAAARIAAVLPLAGETLPAVAIGSQTAAALSPRYQLLQAPAAATADSAQLLQTPVLQRRHGQIALLGGTDDHNTPPSPLLCDALAERGNQVAAVPCYRRSAAGNAQLPQLGRQGGIDAAIAYSGDSLRFMLQMTAPDNDWLRRLPLFVIHANIAAAAKALGFIEIITADSSAMAAQITRRLTR